MVTSALGSSGSTTASPNWEPGADLAAVGKEKCRITRDDIIVVIGSLGTKWGSPPPNPP